LIDDPAFYAVAIPAVLMMGLAKSGFGAGFGALAVPLMALAIPVPQAAAIMLPLLAIMDALGLAAFLRDFDRSLIRLLLPLAESSPEGTGGHESRSRICSRWRA